MFKLKNEEVTSLQEFQYCIASFLNFVVKQILYITFFNAIKLCNKKRFCAKFA